MLTAAACRAMVGLRQRAPTLNLLSSHPADGSPDQLALLIFTGTPELWVTGRPQGLDCAVHAFVYPSPYPLRALGLTSVVNSSTSFMDSSRPANCARAACCSASRC